MKNNIYITVKAFYKRSIPFHFQPKKAALNLERQRVGIVLSGFHFLDAASNLFRIFQKNTNICSYANIKT